MDSQQKQVGIVSQQYAPADLINDQRIITDSVWNMEFSIIKFLLIMFAMALADVFWTLYFIDVDGRRAHHASTWSAMIILVTAFTVTNYVDNQIYIAAAFIGAYLGTFLTIKWKVRQESETDVP